MQEDIMGEILNIPTGLLQKYRNVINTGMGNPGKAISFTNCFELTKNNEVPLKRIINKCQIQLKTMASNFKPNKNN